MLVFFLGLISYSSKIINPFIALKGLIILQIGDRQVAQISKNPTRYISHNYEHFNKYMESNGYIVEQMGQVFQLNGSTNSKSFLSEGFLFGNYYIFTEHNNK